ncbi:SpoU rRNA Methylase family protein [Salinimicrobium catena]|uniref:SpoU rRNA Methylase family protein n=1 Tax=Salinimicrobium catena TaxID=390640 RepID=A0A1H5LMY7_9FLAO|nr:TrmH family RNA methyltransferase [Salinimicrobium catena]SDL11841.1 SpoU rRNA Methylase family protein [Salinimicrobium catena]SEE78364.1 SpoU rRNA Methylase family protein [Salinimicrobium catena]
MIQLSHDAIPFKEKKFPIVLVLDSITGPANVGSLFRLADAFSIEKMIFCGSSFSDLNSSRVKRTARATIKNVISEEQESAVDACRKLAQEGYSILALEISEGSLPVDSLKYDRFEKIALVLGNENSGIDEEVLKLADEHLHINMFGKNSSMNVAQAAGIALFEITKSLQPVK